MTKKAGVLHELLKKEYEKETKKAGVTTSQDFQKN